MCLKKIHLTLIIFFHTNIRELKTLLITKPFNKNLVGESRNNKEALDYFDYHVSNIKNSTKNHLGY